jgi:hypothetical protein
VWVQTNQLAGTGSIQAMGGTGHWDDGGGGGGRIALYYTTATSWFGTTSAPGGLGPNSNADDYALLRQGPGMSNTVNWSGGAGTVFISPSGGNKTLIYDNASTLCTFANCMSLLDLSWSQSNVDLVVSGRALVVTKTPQTGLGIRNVLVTGTSALTADFLGHAGSANELNPVGGAAGSAGTNGTPAVSASRSGSGGAHGGAGGASQNSGNPRAGGSVTYGSLDAPTTLGSGGGGCGNTNSWWKMCWNANQAFNSGGGALYMNIGGTLTLENGAQIRANGGAGWDMPASWEDEHTTVQGGGAGGSVWIQTVNLVCPSTGSATFAARGGKGGNKNSIDFGAPGSAAGGGGGGGGGRISVTHSGTMTNSIGCVFDVTGGAGGTAANSSTGSTGSAGTKRVNGANAP